MHVSSQTFQDLRDEAQFTDFTSNYLKVLLEGTGLRPVVNVNRLTDVHKAWCEDVDRMAHNFGSTYRQTDPTPNHFKQSGNLAFWWRRMAPIIDFEAAEPHPTGDLEKRNRKFMLQYGNEYFALSLAYHLCLPFETGGAAREFKLGEDYISDFCYTLKYKNVSPHMLTLTLQSLFYQRFRSFN